MSSDERRNVVLITIDSLRADRCAHLGGSGRTPTIDYLAEEGLAFEQAVSPGPTTPDAMSVVHTGEFPSVPVDVGKLDIGDHKRRLTHHVEARTTIAERFKRLGYSTAAFTTNPWTSRYFGYRRGYDHFEDFMGGNASRSLVEGKLEDTEIPGAHLVRNALNWAQGQNMFMSWRRYFDDIREWIRGAEEPYFLWVFLVDCHMPYLPSPTNRTGSRVLNTAANAWLYGGADERGKHLFRPPLLRAYDEAVRDTDDFVATIRGSVGADTLIGVHADHGELFGERGAYGHGMNLSEELVHVPFVVANGPTGRVEKPFSLRRLPQLLPRLATGGGVEAAESLTSPQVRTRNYDPTLAVRGDDWTYEWTADGETFYERNALGNERPVRLDDDERIRTGRAVVDRWQDGLNERQRVSAAGADLTANANM